MINLFVTGTDTGVGKTLISSAMIQYFVSQNNQVAAMKPVASGAFLSDGKLVNDDAIQLIEASNVNVDYSLVNPYVFEPPIAPHIAARNVNVEIEFERLDLCYQQLAEKSDVVVIEGAGGWQLPLTEDQSLADWIADHRWPVVMVVGIRLGCINHTRLTYLDILAKKNKLAGWVANIIDADTLEIDAIIKDLSDYVKAPLLGVVPQLKSISDVHQHLDFFKLDLTSKP